MCLCVYAWCREDSVARKSLKELSSEGIEPGDYHQGRAVKGAGASIAKFCSRSVSATSEEQEGPCG